MLGLLEFYIESIIAWTFALWASCFVFSDELMKDSPSYNSMKNKGLLRTCMLMLPAAFIFSLIPIVRLLALIGVLARGFKHG